VRQDLAEKEMDSRTALKFEYYQKHKELETFSGFLFVGSHLTEEIKED